MAGFLSRSSTRWSLLVVANFVAGALLGPHQAVGDIVLDDFGDSAIAISPDMENEFVVTENVGILHATRRIGTGGGGTDPNGQIDANISAPSKLTAALNGHERTNTLTPTISYVFRYDFAVTDATDQAENDAIILDFASFSGTAQPFYLRGFATELSHPNEFFEIRVNVPLISGPIAVAMPFSDFHFRASNEGTADFGTLTSASFDFFFLGPNEDTKWSMQLERVRFGRIPEPSTRYSCLFAGVLLVSRWSPVRNRSLKAGGQSDVGANSYRLHYRRNLALHDADIRGH